MSIHYIDKKASETHVHKAGEFKCKPRIQATPSSLLLYLFPMPLIGLIEIVTLLATGQLHTTTVATLISTLTTVMAVPLLLL